MIPSTRKLMLTADDFGASSKANHAIFDLVALHKIDRVGVMIRGILTPEDFVSLKNANVKIDIHLDIPLLHNTLKLHDNTLRRISIFLFHMICGHISPQKISDEWESQITSFHKKFGTMPDGINSHEHTHFFPPYFRIACTLARKNHIPFIRCGSDGPLPRTTMISMILSILHMFNRRILKSFPMLSTTKHVTSIDWLSKRDLSNVLHKTETELLFHPERPKEYQLIKELTWKENLQSQSQK